MWQWNTRWTHWYRRTLPAYWIFLFCATHFPDLRLAGPLPRSDKLLHLVAFAILAFLFWRFVESFRRPLPSSFVWVSMLSLCTYAALDEFTQMFVGRSTDVRDWVSNCGGIILTLLVLEWRRRAARPTLPSAKPD